MSAIIWYFPFRMLFLAQGEKPFKKVHYELCAAFNNKTNWRKKNTPVIEQRVVKEQRRTLQEETAVNL